LVSFSATWRSGYAAACKAVYTGSIPVVASDAKDPFGIQINRFLEGISGM
jgi:hypothetical protein